MGRTEDSGEPPVSSAPSPPSAEVLAAASASDDRAEPTGLKVLRDDDVDEIEQQITDDDLLQKTDRRIIENTRRRMADLVWLEEAAAAGFSGPVFEVQWEEFARYGIAVMMNFTRTGKIFSLCARRSWPITPGPLVRDWSRDDRLEIVVETIGRALDAFLNKVLIPGVWDPGKGASLKTFFIGQALRQFPNVFNRWAREHDGWHTQHLVAAELPDDDLRQEPGPPDPTCEAALAEPNKQALLEQIEDPVTRQIVERLAQGCTQVEAGAPFGLSARAVEGRLRRLRLGRGWLEWPMQ